MLSDGVLVTLITTLGTVVTTAVTSYVVVRTGRKTRRDVHSVHDSVNEGRREAIIRSVPEQPGDVPPVVDMTFPDPLQRRKK